MICGFKDMITVFFKTDTVEASQGFHADAYKFASGRVTLYSGNRPVATFKESSVIYLFRDEYSMATDEEEE